MAALKLTLQSTVRLTTGHELPLIGLGVALSDDTEGACAAALQHGYRHIDSARHYKNEADVGRAVHASGLKREEVFVTSKIFDGEHGYEKTKTAVQESLNNFGFDYLDLYLIHSPRAGKEMRLATWRALLELQTAGKLRSVGVSNYGPKHMDEIREAGLPMPAVNQVELHPFCQQRPIVEYCKREGIAVQAYAPLVRARRMEEPLLVELAKKHNKEVAQILVRWSLQKGFVALPKSSQPARIALNAAVYDFALPAEDMTRIDALDEGAKGAVTWNPVNSD